MVMRYYPTLSSVYVNVKENLGMNVYVRALISDFVFL